MLPKIKYVPSFTHLVLTLAEWKKSVEALGGLLFQGRLCKKNGT